MKLGNASTSFFPWRDVRNRATQHDRQNDQCEVTPKSSTIPNRQESFPRIQETNDLLLRMYQM